MLSRSRLADILDACKTLRVAVIGDFNLDAYWVADMTRSQLSREAPLFPRPVVRETYTPGGAANVTWNLAALGVGEVHALTVLGRDWRGDLLGRSLESAGVRLDRGLSEPGWSTPLFGKVILTAHGSQQEDARLDFVNPRPLSPEMGAALLARADALLPQLHALVVADYQPAGALTNGMRAALSRMAEGYPAVTFVADSREQIGAYRSMVLKPNGFEAARYLFPDREPESLALEDFVAAGLRLRTLAGKPVFITLGSRGCLVFDDVEAARLLPGIPVSPPVDPVGAGDAFLAGVAACLAAGATPMEAGAVANLAAAVTVKKLHTTGTASPDEILQLYDAQHREGPRQ